MLKNVRRPALTALATILALAASLTPAGAAPSTRATLTGSAPPWASSSNFKSAAAATDSVGFRLYLGWNNASALQQFATSVTTPGSATYGQYLTPEQFHAQYSPSQAQVNAVKSWLTSQGFDITYVPANNHYVAAEGTVAQASAAFGVAFNTYSVDGLLLRSPAADVSVPASLAGIVNGVIGLDDTAQLVHNDISNDPDATPSPAFVSASPCSTYWGQLPATGYTNPYGDGTLPYTPCGYTPQQVKGAYGLGSTPYDGKDQTVAIIDAFASPTIVDDVNTWSSARNLPALSPGQLTQVVAPGTYKHPERGLAQDPQGWYGEQTLDIEAVHGMAPGASIVYVGAPNSFQDLDAALNHVVDRHLAQIVTNSYGFNTERLAPGFIYPYQDIFIQAAVEGIGVYFSSGDNSDESLVDGYATADFPPSSPWVTAVGGTSLAVGASDNYLFETGWGTARSKWSTSCSTTPTWCPTPPGGWIYGSGGGVSTVFPEPYYQQGVAGVSTAFKAQGHSGRAVPDISTIGDPNTGYLIGQTQTFPDGTTHYSEYRIGGTSLSSPILAGIMALADEVKGAPHGFANPAFYSLGSTVYNDIVTPKSIVATVRADYYDFVNPSSGPLRISLRTFNDTLSLKTTPGWDDVTGLGTPKASFIGALAS